jgi:hypothetical protein
MAGDFLSIIKPTDKTKAGEAEAGEKTAKKALPVLPVRDTVLFPHAVLPLTVGRESSIQLINSRRSRYWWWRSGMRGRTRRRRLTCTASARWRRSIK